jgi:Zinc-finger containing family/Zinc finger C-x8-C-x5-C-x3-H type (and similar)
MTAAEQKATDCVFFMQNRCAHGPACSFRHSEAAAKTQDVCFLWGTYQWCDGITCGKQHPVDPRRPMPVARAAAAVAAVAKPVRARADAPPCSFFAKGRCNKGDACPFQHIAKEPLTLREAAAAAQDSDTPQPAADVLLNSKPAGEATVRKADAVMEKYSLSRSQAAAAERARQASAEADAPVEQP